MTKVDISGTLNHQFPDGFRMRPFNGNGDCETWVAVQNAANPYPGFTAELFDKEFGYDLAAMPDRCYFLVSPCGRDIGTITAWYDNQYPDKQFGRLHWLAISTEFHRQGLAKPLISFCVDKLRELGHTRAMLVSDTTRTTAIKCYLDLGFVPDMTTPDAHLAWPIIAQSVPHPVLKELLAV